jgi:hypothetical protein
MSAKGIRIGGIAPLIAMKMRDIERLSAAHSEDDLGKIDGLVARIYGLSDNDMKLIHELL